MRVDLSLYVLLDPARAGGRALPDIAAAAVRGGATLVQLRDKESETGAFVKEARAIKRALAGSRVPLLINDRVDVALASGADGVHLGRDDLDLATARRLLGPRAIIGASSRSRADIEALPRRHRLRPHRRRVQDFEQGQSGQAIVLVGSWISRMVRERARPRRSAHRRHRREQRRRGDARGRRRDRGASRDRGDYRADPESARREAPRAISDGRRTARKRLAMTAIALTIAGSDSGGGAGIQADLKTFSALGVYGASVITALTAQNTLGVTGIHDVPADFIAAQMDAVYSDLAVAATKIGMLSLPSTIETVARGLDRHSVKNIVLDPVMVAASGASLLKPEAIETLKRELIPRALVVTPNLHEAAALTAAAGARRGRDAGAGRGDSGARRARGAGEGRPRRGAGSSRSSDRAERHAPVRGQAH
jgi:hypothetical protein